VDADEGAGLTLTNSALVTQYFSQPSTITTDRKQYAATPPQTTSINTPAPAGIAKSVSVSSAAIGAAAVYTITVPSTTVSSVLYNVHVLDTIPAGLTFSAVGNNAGALALGGCPSISVTDHSNLGTNTLDVLYSCLPANTQAVIVATTTVQDISGNVKGAVFSNAASYTWRQTPSGSDSPAVSTSGITTPSCPARSPTRPRACRAATR
jgi:uncharacterized repeat protein (TIGR01451 family)